VDVVEYFFKTLEKEGLYKGHIDFGNKLYTFSISDGVSQINVKEKSTPAEDKQMTIERSPAAISDDRSFYVTKSGDKERKSSSFKFIFFILIFVAITVLLVVGIPYLSKKPTNGNKEESSWLLAEKVNTTEAYRGYLADFPNGKYSLESRNRIEQFLSQGGERDDFQKYYTQASDFYDQDELDKAFSAVEKAKKIKKSEKITELEQKIIQKIETKKKDEEFNNYIKITESALKDNDLEKANENLMLAKNIKSNPQIVLLENKIKLQESELKKKKGDTKRDDVYNRYFNFARNYYQDGNYSKALEQVKKAKKIKNTPELIKFETQVQSKLKGSQKVSQAQIKEDKYQNHLNSARQDFKSGKYVQALNSIKIARKIKSSAELDSLEKEILRVQKGLEDEKSSIEKEKKQKENTQEYNKYKTRAETYYGRGEYNKALYNVNRAKKINNTAEIKDLEKKIKNKKNQMVAVKSVNLMSLPPSMINSYNSSVKKIDILNIPGGVKALGQISLRLAIAQNGKLTIQQLNESRLRTVPPRSRRLVISRISRTINSIILSPPINRNGEPVRIENWRVSYNVGTFMGKIILRRRF